MTGTKHTYNRPEFFEDTGEMDWQKNSGKNINISRFFIFTISTSLIVLLLLGLIKGAAFLSFGPWYYNLLAYGTLSIANYILTRILGSYANLHPKGFLHNLLKRLKKADKISVLLLFLLSVIATLSYFLVVPWWFIFGVAAIPLLAIRLSLYISAKSAYDDDSSYTINDKELFLPFMMFCFAGLSLTLHINGVAHLALASSYYTLLAFIATLAFIIVLSRLMSVLATNYANPNAEGLFHELMAFIQKRSHVISPALLVAAALPVLFHFFHIPLWVVVAVPAVAVIATIAVKLVLFIVKNQKSEGIDNIYKKNNSYLDDKEEEFFLEKNEEFFLKKNEEFSKKNEDIDEYIDYKLNLSD